MELIINGQKIYYEQTGRGTPLVLLHGWGTDSRSFAGIIPVLASSFSVYALDFSGFGNSPPPAKAWSVHDYADLVREFLAELLIEKPIIIGHSFGGRIGICLGAQDIPRKMILTGSAGIVPKRKPIYYIRVYSYKAAKVLFSLPPLRRRRESALALWQKRTASSDYNNAQGVMRETFVKVVNKDLQYLMPDIKCPTLLLWGEQDTETPLAYGQKMEKLISGSGLAVIKGAGHYAFLDAPSQFLRITDSFLTPDKTK